MGKIIVLFILIFFLEMGKISNSV